MRVLVTGANGLLGREVIGSLQRAGHEPMPVGKAEFDISHPVSGGRILAQDFGRLGAVINCAGFTQVDLAETEPEAAFEVNSVGPGLIARACAIEGIPLVHFSTDYVFDGESATPYVENEPTNPLNVYGRSKLEGELAVLSHHPGAFVLRTSWLFSSAARCFPRSIHDRWETGGVLRVVSDQTGSPTYATYLADATVRLLDSKGEPGLYHAAGVEAMTWYDFACRLLRMAGASDEELQGRLTPIHTSDWPTPARRPRFSVLNSEKLQSVIGPMRDLDSALGDFVQRTRRLGK